VIGSLSGSSEFNLEFVQAEIESMLEADTTLWFLAPNIKRFTNQPRALFLPPILSKELKLKYLNSLDVFVHARLRGETFGLAIAEALAAGKPVVSWSGGIDQNHTRMVGLTGGLYRDKLEFHMAIDQFRDLPPKTADQISRVSDFTPEKVANKFKQVFLN
jgi:glycosyltransferase involved in cell wall biosynthesis